MFWRFNFQGSTLDQLLSKPETTLEDILNQAEVIQELKTQNAKLLAFIAQPDKIQRMLSYISSFNENYAPVCSEIFGLELPQIAAVLFTSTHIIESFIKEMLLKEWSGYEGLSFIKVVSSILYRDPKSSLKLLKAVKLSNSTFLEAICIKISKGQTILYELLLKLSALDEVLTEDFIVNWFKEEKLVDFLVSQLHFKNINEPDGLDRISSATSCLLDFFAVAQAISVVQVPLHENHIILDIVSSPWIIQSLDFINEYYITLLSNQPVPVPQLQMSNAFTTLLSLVNDIIRRNYLDFVLGLHQQALTIRMEEFTEQDVMINILKDPKKYLLDVTAIAMEMSKYMDLFYNILKTPISKYNASTSISQNALNIMEVDYVESSIGTLKVFGIERYKTCELLVELLRMVIDEDQILIHEKLKQSIEDNNEALEIKTSAPVSMDVCISSITDAFINSNILVLFIDLFFEYPWNNILHSLVLDVITFVFDPPVQILATHILSKSKIIQMICKSSKLNQQNVLKPRSSRLPYQGHITLISEILLNHLNKSKSYYESIDRQGYLNDIYSEEWLEYSLKILPETIKKDRQTLGGVKPPSNMLGGGEASVMAQGSSSIISSDSGYMMDPFHHKTSDDILHKPGSKLSSLEQLTEPETTPAPTNDPVQPAPVQHTNSSEKQTTNAWKYTNIEDPFEMTVAGQWMGQEIAKGFIEQVGQLLPIQFVSPSIAAIDGSGLTFAKDLTSEPHTNGDLIDPFDIPMSPKQDDNMTLHSHKEEMSRKEQQRLAQEIDKMKKRQEQINQSKRALAEELDTEEQTEAEESDGDLKMTQEKRTSEDSTKEEVPVPEDISEKKEVSADLSEKKEYSADISEKATDVLEKKEGSSLLTDQQQVAEIPEKKEESLSSEKAIFAEPVRKEENDDAEAKKILTEDTAKEQVIENK